MIRRRRSLKLIIGAVVFAAAALAQPPVPMQDDATLGGSAAPMEGLHVYNVTFYGSYYSSLMNLGLSTGYDLATGGSATVGWTRTRTNSSLFLSYTPSYMRDVTQSELSSLSHNFSFTFNHKVHRTWNLSTSLNAQVMNMDQFVFQPNLFTQVTATAATPDELAAALLTNANQNNAYLAALLTGAPLLESPAQSVYFGDRMLTAAFQVAAEHKGPRLSVSFLGGGTRIQNLAGPVGQPGQPAFLVPAATTGMAGVAVSYSLSPRTEIGVNASSQRTVSRYEDSYTSTVEARLGRRMGERWFVEMHGGTGFFQLVRSLAPLPGGPQYVMGGGFGFKTQSHSLLLSSERDIADLYGYGASSDLITTAAWNWGRRNRGWRILASGSYQQIHSTSFPNINAWLASAGFSQRISRATSMNITYAYMQTGNYPGVPGTGNLHALRVMFVWMPSTFTN